MIVENVENYEDVQKLISKLNWKVGVDFPEWGYNLEYLQTISKGYLLDGETPKDAYKRVVKSACKYLNRTDLEDKFFEYIWNGWLCLASPVLSNLGTSRGLPISCYCIDIDDSLEDISAKNRELMLLGAGGGGVGINHNRIRPSGSVIRDNGTSSGAIPFIKINDSTILATSQGNFRRGASSSNMNIDNPDFLDWLHIREAKGDVNRQCLNMHQCAVIDDSFMKRLEDGDKDARNKWKLLIQQRKVTGEPYIMFSGNVNKDNPLSYKQNNLEVSATNICSEIVLFTDKDHSFVCCLSSLNLAKYNEWKDSDIIYYSTYFLDAVLSEFIDKASKIKGFENAVRSAEKGRAIGLGALGYHTYLQQEGIPFEGLLSQFITREMFSKIKLETERASKDLAKEYGEPLWCKGTSFRNTHLRALAPTVSNSKLSGGISASIEPIPANMFIDQSAKGTFIRKNKTLIKYMNDMNLSDEVIRNIWKKVHEDLGSIQNIEIFDNYGFIDKKLVEISDKNKFEVIPFKEVFKTFREVNQLDLVKLASVRQEYIDQAVSLNLAFPKDIDPSWVNRVHYEAYKLGIKTLYYFRSTSKLRSDIGVTSECSSCEG